MDDFLQKLKMVVRIVLYGPAISQSDSRKAGPYQLPIIKKINAWKISRVGVNDVCTCIC